MKLCWHLQSPKLGSAGDRDTERNRKRQNKLASEGYLWAGGGGEGD